MYIRRYSWYQWMQCYLLFPTAIFQSICHDIMHNMHLIKNILCSSSRTRSSFSLAAARAVILASAWGSNMGIFGVLLVLLLRNGIRFSVVWMMNLSNASDESMHRCPIGAIGGMWLRTMWREPTRRLLACSSDLCLTAWAKTRVDDGENSLLIIILLQAIQ